MADQNYYQHDGEYPYLEGLPDTINDVSLPLPSSYFVQMDGDYPFLPNEQKILSASEPFPIGFFSQKDDVNDGYPYIDVPDKLNVSEPVPWSFFIQKADVNDGYPYLILPVIIDELTKPLPYALFKPNRAKKIEFEIVIDNCINEVVIENCVNKITIPKYEVVLDSGL